MAVVNVSHHPKTSGSVSIGNGLNTFELGIEEVWDVLCDDPATAFLDAYATDQLPALHSLHPDIPAAQLVRKRPKLLSPILVEVTCEYAGRSSPLSEPYERSGRTIHSREIIETDNEGNLLANPNGDRLTGVEEDVPEIQEIVTRNEATRPTALMREYVGSISNDMVGVWQPGEAKVMDITPVYMTKQGGVWYWRVTYTIGFRKSVNGVIGWQRRFVCDGLRYWTGKYKTDGSKQILPCTDAGSSTPVRRKLDATGKLLADGAADVFITKWTRPRVAINALGLGVGL